MQQESAKYAHELFQGTVKLFGRPLRIKYSPQGEWQALSLHLECHIAKPTLFGLRSLNRPRHANVLVFAGKTETPEE